MFGRNRQQIDETLALLAGGTERHGGAVADASRSEEVRTAFREAVERFGKIHALVSCAAVGWSLAVDSEDEDWEYVLRTNLLGTIACVREAVLHMKRSGEGHIVLMGSLSAEVKEPMGSMYVASKGGIRALAGSLRKELNPAGISVSLIEPGCTGTDLHREDAEKMNAKVGEHKMLKPDHVAEALIFTLTRPEGCELISLQLRPRMELI